MPLPSVDLCHRFRHRTDGRLLFWIPTQWFSTGLRACFVFWLAWSPFLPSRVFGGGCGHFKTSTPSVWLRSRPISAASSSGRQFLHSAAPISGSVILSIFSCWFSSGPPPMEFGPLAFQRALDLWIVFGTVLEEKDLVAEFGETYRDYQKNVPMLFPWRFPGRKTIKSH